MRAEDGGRDAEALREDFLKLDLRRIERELRHAEQEDELEAQRSLSQERQR